MSLGYPGHQGSRERDGSRHDIVPEIFLATGRKA
jgi:hypothetical protein